MTYRNSTAPVLSGSVLRAPSNWLDQKRQYEHLLDQALHVVSVRPQLDIDRQDLARSWRSNDPQLARLGADVIDAVPELFTHAPITAIGLREREVRVLQLTEIKCEADSAARQVADALLGERASLHRDNGTLLQIITANLENPGLPSELRGRLQRHATPFLNEVAAAREAVLQSRNQTLRIKAESSDQVAQTAAAARAKEIEIGVLRGGAVPSSSLRTSLPPQPTAPRTPRRRGASRG